MLDPMDPAAARPISLRARLGLVALVFLVLVMVAVGLSALKLRSWDRTLDRRVEVRHAANDVAELRLAFTDQETGIRGYQLSEDPLFLQPYDDGDAVGLSVSKVLEAAFFLCMMGIGPTSPLQSVIQKTRSSSAAAPPQGIEAALNHLEHALSLKDKTAIANMTADELVSLHFSLGDYINNHFGLFTANTELLEECRQRSGNDELAPIDAAAVIIRLLWKRLRAAYRIRVVK